MMEAAPLLRTSPRLWVERLWILDALDAVKPLRDVSFSQGLNLVVSAPGDGNTGHGVGKTALCQLLRCVLEDPNWAAGTPLRDELLHSFPTGAVAARVYVDGECWTVLKPWKHQLHYRASRDSDWQALAHDEVPNDYDAYVTALNQTLVDVLPVKKFPGSGQPIQWQHILAWCSRDQECRYQGYYHWRAEGMGFSLPAQSPAVLVKVVLGLLDDASSHHKLKQAESNIAKLETSIANLERRPKDLLEHVRHQLAEALDQPQSSPFRPTGLLDQSSLKGLAEQRVEAYSSELAQLRADRSATKGEREQVIAESAPLQGQLKAVVNRVGQLENAIAGNVAKVAELKNEASALQGRLQVRCEDGNRLVGACQYVQERVASISIDSVRDATARKAQTAQWQNELAQLRTVATQVERRLQPFRRQLEELSNSVAESQQREIAATASQQRLQEAISAYELYEGITAGTLEWHELKAAQDELRKQERIRDGLVLEIKQRRDGFADRRKVIESTLESLAARLPGFSWGVLREGDQRPFRLGPPHSTAFAVLETLIGDVVCLIDSRNPQSFHPGFLLHDSPREAELSEPVFWKYLAAVAEQQEAVQYIVTTSTDVPDEHKGYLRLELSNDKDEAMLFRTRLGVEQESLN